MSKDRKIKNIKDKISSVDFSDIDVSFEGNTYQVCIVLLNSIWKETIEVRQYNSLVTYCKTRLEVLVENKDNKGDRELSKWLKVYQTLVHIDDDCINS